MSIINMALGFWVVGARIPRVPLAFAAVEGHPGSGRQTKYICYCTPLPLNLANKQQQQQQARHRSVLAIAPSHRLGLDSTLAILEPRWWPCQIQVLSQKITGGGPGRWRQVGRCPPQSAQFWASSRSTAPVKKQVLCFWLVLCCYMYALCTGEKMVGESRMPGHPSPTEWRTQDFKVQWTRTNQILALLSQKRSICLVVFAVWERWSVQNCSSSKERKCCPSLCLDQIICSILC